MRIDLLPLFLLTCAQAGVLPQKPFGSFSKSRNISDSLFNELEELARVVDISYCVGVTGTGIQKPFECASRCHEFPDFELVKVCSLSSFLREQRH